MSGAFRHMLVNVFTLSLSLFLLLVVVLLVRTFTLSPRALEAPPCDPEEEGFIPLDEARLQRFRQALRFKTVSSDHGPGPTDELRKIQQFIKISYPTIHKSPLVTFEAVANYSLLYHIQGSNPELKPFLLMGHIDVVPESPGDWHAEPFSGDVLGDFIYGRGTIDDKHQVFGILEALEFLLKEGHKPQRPFYVSFGHDEEIMGWHGAKAVGDLLGQRGVQFEFIMDEGLTVTKGIVLGMTKPAALIGSTEKGYATLKLSVNMTGGHSSMPDKESAIGVLARAVARLEANPQPIMFGKGPEVGMLEQLAPEMNLFYRIFMSNLWLFGPLISRIMAGQPASSALIRTTTAITEFHAGIKQNVIAPSATATVNHRLHPAQSLEEVLAHDRWAMNDERVAIEVIAHQPPLPQSPYGDTSFGYQMIKKSIRQVWGHEGVAVAPGLLIGNTDTKHVTHLSSNIYRFAPTVMHPEDVARFHGLNERISKQNYEQAINFFYHLMRNADKEKLDPMHDHGQEL